VVVVADRLRVKSRLEEMAQASVPFVEALSMDTVDPVKPSRNAFHLCLNDDMKVVRHRAVRVAFPPLA
jgi:hypothetical protein